MATARAKKNRRNRRSFRKLQRDPQRRRKRNDYFAEKMRARRAHLSAIPPELHGQTHSIVTASQLQRPPLLWIGPDGTLRSEKWESAEELIERLTRQKKRARGYKAVDAKTKKEAK
jgi:hypothetical protein